jgi:hypothetical protein
MKFKNFDGKEYEVLYLKPHYKHNADGLCDNPDIHKHPSILINPKLNKRRQLNVLIEEVFHAHLYELPERKARKFAANLGKLIYNKFLKNENR